jgi:hypothetical protein
MNRYISGFIKLAEDLDRSGRTVLAEDIDQRLLEVAYLSTLPSSELSKFPHEIINLIEDDCESCGSERYAEFNDWTESPEMREIHKMIYTDDDIDEHDMYTKTHGDDFPDGDGVLSKKELIKTLMSERDVYNTMLTEAINNGINPEEEETMRSINGIMNEIDEQISQLSQ